MRYVFRFLATILIFVVGVCSSAFATSAQQIQRLEELAEQVVGVTYYAQGDQNAANRRWARVNQGQPYMQIYVSIRRDGEGPWVADQISFAPIPRASPNHEVLRFVTGPNWARDKQHLIVSAAYETAIRTFATDGEEIERITYVCGDIADQAVRRAREGLYTLCNSKFSRVSPGMTVGMLLYGGPLGVGNYRIYNHFMVADAVLQADIVTTVRALFVALEPVAGRLDLPPPNLLSPMSKVMKARVDLAMGHTVGAVYRDAALRDVLDVGRAPLRAIMDRVSDSYRPNAPQLARVYPFVRDVAGSPAMAAIDDMKGKLSAVLPESELITRLNQELDRQGLNLPCTDPRQAYADTRLVSFRYWNLEYGLGCDPFASWPKTSSTLAGKPIVQPSLWLVPTAGTYNPVAAMVGFSMSDPVFVVTVDDSGTASIQNKTASFATVKSLSFYIGDQITTHTFEKAGVPLAPYSKTSLERLLSLDGSGATIAEMSRAPVPRFQEPSGGWRSASLPPFSQTLGFALFYEAGGPARTLMKQASFSVIGPNERAQ